MAIANEILTEAFDRVQQSVHRVLDGLTEEQLAWRPDPQANTIAWLVWHLARVQDDHLAELVGGDQVWKSGGWDVRFGLPFDTEATGFGMTPEEVGRVRAGAELLAGYYDAVHDATRAYLVTLADEDFPRVVDERWDPPVTLLVRLVSILNDDIQHAGQAAYVRGLLERS